MRIRTLLLVLFVAATANRVQVRADEIPEDAASLIAAFDEDAEALRFETERKIAEQRRDLAAKLKLLQDEYTKQARLDEAVAIRDFIRALSVDTIAAEPAPHNVLQLNDKIGRSLYFKVVGNESGSVYGTAVYTGDSSIATAAVHSGVLKHGEEGVVRVRVLPGRNSYESSTQHGITSSGWSTYPISFSVEKVPHFGADENEVEVPKAAIGAPPASVPPAAPPEPTTLPPQERDPFGPADRP